VLSHDVFFSIDAKVQAVKGIKKPILSISQVSELVIDLKK
jgi:hypothetical protein